VLTGMLIKCSRAASFNALEGLDMVGMCVRVEDCLKRSQTVDGGRKKNFLFNEKK
jgi:hypothetical protein